MDGIAEKILTLNKIDVDVKTDFNIDELKDKISEYDGLIIRSATKVTKEIIESAKNLKIIGRNAQFKYLHTHHLIKDAYYAIKDLQ